MTTAIVVGGGIGGIVSALLLKRHYDNVLLVERAAVPGGLLRTSHTRDGLSFDFGTHFIATTGLDDLDELLFDFVNAEDWYEFDYLKAGHYHGGLLNGNSTFIDARSLPRQTYLEGLEQMLLATPSDETPVNLEQQLDDTYGVIFRTQLFTPVLQKLFGVEPQQLAPDAHLLFGLQRLLILSADASRELKNLPRYDQCIAFHQLDEGVNQASVFYPRHGGIGRWIDGLTEKLSAAGVEMLTGHFVQGVSHQNGQIDSITLDDGRHLDCNQLVWTVPPFLLAKAADLDVPMHAPQLRHTRLFHFIFDRPFTTDLHYLYVHDPAMSAFRVTLYSNVAGQDHDPEHGYHCTVEVLSDGKEDASLLSERIHNELIAMGLVSEDAVCRYINNEALAAGFPVLSQEFVAAGKQQADCLTRQLNNLHLLGKSSGSAFFMNDVLREVYDALNVA